MNADARDSAEVIVVHQWARHMVTWRLQSQTEWRAQQRPALIWLVPYSRPLGQGARDADRLGHPY
eukprot:scaffold479763_cov37-Prasinocladus_malaysianus.AAC.1